MKLKENNYLLNKGLDQNQGWTKIMNFLKKTFPYEELKEVFFLQKRLAKKNLEAKNIKILKKLKKRK